MIRAVARGALVRGLLNALAAERHLRRPILRELIAELSCSARFDRARRLASALLARIDDLDDHELARDLDEVRARLARPAPVWRSRASEARRGRVARARVSYIRMVPARSRTIAQSATDARPSRS